MATCSALSCSSTHYTIITTCRFIKRCVKTRINQGEVQNLRAAPCQPRCGVFDKTVQSDIIGDHACPRPVRLVHSTSTGSKIHCAKKTHKKHYKIPKLSFYISYRSIKSINLVAKYNLSLSTFSISVANCIFQNECRLYSQKADILEDFFESSNQVFIPAKVHIYLSFILLTKEFLYFSADLMYMYIPCMK